jgi:membrane-bound serine protease (ClpP class)
MDLSIPAFQGILVILVVGFVLIAAEVFVPGMILGILGTLCLIAGVAWSYVEYGAGTGTMVLAGVGILGTAAFLLYMKVFSRTFIGRGVINKGALANDPDPVRPALLGHSGTALTVLRPAGTAKIEGRRVDVIAEGNFIEAGAPITVVRVEGNRVTVRRTLS